MDTVNIVADHREDNSYVLEHLNNLEVNVIKKQLDVGDYICSERVAIERKTISDFLQSIIDQRLFKQLDNMKNSYEKPILLLEGDPEKLFDRAIHPNTIRGALASIAIDFNIPIIWTRHARETANQIYWIGYREQIKDRKDLSIRTNKKSLTVSDEQEYIISGLPNINNKLSKRLLEHFKTPGKVFKANEGKLQLVEGIGKDKAKKIREILDKEYQ